MQLPGTPSDQVEGVLAAGRGDVSTLFVSMATRHPDGADAEYLRWHTLDHRPEQHRISQIRASLRLVSTPECRNARTVSHHRFDAVDHVMTYFFADQQGLQAFLDLATALSGAGRKLPLLPPVERGVYDVHDKRAAARIKVGADVLPWWPITGVFVVLEEGPAQSLGTGISALLDVDGVGGVWSTSALDVGPKLASAPPGQQLTYCFLDDDPVATAARLGPPLTRRWQDGTDIKPLLAAPFRPVVPYQWDRYLP